MVSSGDPLSHWNASASPWLHGRIGRPFSDHTSTKAYRDRERQVRCLSLEDYADRTAEQLKWWEGLNGQYKASPLSFTLGLEAKTIWEGRGLGNLARSVPGSSERFGRPSPVSNCSG